MPRYVALQDMRLRKIRVNGRISALQIRDNRQTVVWLPASQATHMLHDYNVTGADRYQT
jgi:hypothetical protein